MRKPRKSIPIDAHEGIVVAYQQGVTLQELAAQYDVTGSTVAEYLRRLGVVLRTRREINQQRALIDECRLRSLVDQSLTLPEIGTALGVSVSAIERCMRTLGLRSKHGRGSPMEKNYFWKGGRAVDTDGYILVKSPDHPYATKAGYVREHRLIMEEKLGRYLLPVEVVHHKDQNHNNNAPDNLQVFQTNGAHLRHELTGKTPNYTPHGLQRMRENALRLNRRRWSSTRPAQGTDVLP